MTKKKILVLGNGVSINDIDFSRLDPSIQTFGVNRIWLKHYPNYFFFQDADIIKELNVDIVSRSKLIAKSQCFSSDWANNSVMNFPHWLRKYPRANRRKFPDSITTGMQILMTNILKGKPSDYVFYMAGISLKWEEPSHFWKVGEYDSLNNKDKDWYDIRFSKMFKNFRDIKSIGYNMISVTPNSMLNKMVRSESISNLYTK
jgi:hypothetical protein